jgi:hypothetical protein
MLINEDKMSESAGIVLTQPGRGLSYQIAGALQRLGRRMIGLVPTAQDQARIKEIPMQTYVHDWLNPDSGPLEFSQPFSTLVVAPEPWLGRNHGLERSVVLGLEKLLQEAQSLNPELEVIFVVPAATEFGLLAKIRRFLPSKGILFVTPAVFGFRDEALMDQALGYLSDEPGALESRSPSLIQTESTPLVYAGDVASFVVSAPGRSDLYGKVIEIPPSAKSIEEWREAFLKAFQPKAGLWDKLKARFGHSYLGHGLDLGPARVHPELDFEFTSALQVFPSALTPLARALEQSARVFRKNPELDLHFPPGRAP